MNSLTVLYDASCGFCRRCVAWLKEQPRFLHLKFVPSQSEEARRLFPGIRSELAVNELTVVDDSGGVYYGERAYLMCLYALSEYREWSIRLSEPALRPFVKRAFGALTSSRHTLSALFTTDNDPPMK